MAKAGECRGGREIQRVLLSLGLGLSFGGWHPEMGRRRPQFWWLLPPERQAHIRLIPEALHCLREPPKWPWSCAHSEGMG